MAKHWHIDARGTRKADQRIPYGEERLRFLRAKRPLQPNKKPVNWTFLWFWSTVVALYAFVGWYLACI